MRGRVGRYNFANKKQSNAHKMTRLERIAETKTIHTPLTFPPAAPAGANLGSWGSWAQKYSPAHPGKGRAGDAHHRTAAERLPRF